MIVINYVNIKEDGHTMSISAVINGPALPLTTFFDSIVIDTQDTYLSTGPSTTPIYTKSIVDESGHHTLTTINIDIDLSQLGVDITKTMFFVYFKETSTETIVGETKLAVTMSLRNYYVSALTNLKELDYKCEIPKDFIDTYLLVQAILLCLETKSYEMAIRYWNKYYITNLICNT